MCQSERCSVYWVYYLVVGLTCSKQCVIYTYSVKHNIGVKYGHKPHGFYQLTRQQPNQLFITFTLQVNELENTHAQVRRLRENATFDRKVPLKSLYNALPAVKGRMNCEAEAKKLSARSPQAVAIRAPRAVTN